jgi:hypothetical protein
MQLNISRPGLIEAFERQEKTLKMQLLRKCVRSHALSAMWNIISKAMVNI